MCIFAKYKDIFGVPGEGVHAYRFLGVGVIDLVSTLLVGMLISYMFSMPIVVAVTGLFLLSVVFHYLFGVKTSVMTYLNIL